MPQARLKTPRFHSGRWPVVAVLLGGLLAWPARAQTSNPTTPINEFCPVMTDEEVDPEFTAMYDGKLVGLCCDRCQAKFKANPQRYASRLPALLASAPPEGAAEHGESHHSDTGSAAGDDHEHNAGGQHTIEEMDPTETHGHTESSRAQPIEGEGDHDHETDHGQASGFVSRLIAWLGNFHPPAVNFPIAMLAGAAIAELLLMLNGRVFFANAGRFCLWIGALGAVPAATLGWFFGGFHLIDDSWILTTHRWLGTSTAAWSVLVLVLGERAVRLEAADRRGYRAVLFIGATLVSVTGFFGGALVYGFAHYAW